MIIKSEDDGERKGGEERRRGGQLKGGEGCGKTDHFLFDGQDVVCPAF